MKLPISLLVLSTLSGCAINQRGEPAPPLSMVEICIIENPDVRESFLTVYRDALMSKGYQAHVLEENATTRDCPQTSRYTANWRWDLVLYMAFADISVYADGQRVGHAVYDSLQGGGNPNKFINAEAKIRELVDQLFPHPAPTVGGEQ